MLTGFWVKHSTENPIVEAHHIFQFGSQGMAGIISVNAGKHSQRRFFYYKKSLLLLFHHFLYSKTTSTLEFSQVNSTFSYHSYFLHSYKCNSCNFQTFSDLFYFFYVCGWMFRVRDNNNFHFSYIIFTSKCRKMCVLFIRM